MKLRHILYIVVALLIINVTGYAHEGKIQLEWKNAEDAVMYELEVATVPLGSRRVASSQQVVYRTTEIFTPGVELDLSLFDEYKLNRLYYRVRPLDLDKNPIAEFTQGATIAKGTLNPSKPKVTSFLKKGHPPLLYPAYSWIPVLGATHYEVEITNQLPENPNGIEASRHRIRSYSIEGGFDCYDTHSYNEAGTYYWRVRAIGDDNQAIGTYSDANSFTVSTMHYTWAVFGDSITHGGGAVSNPPSDERFEYVSYLPFPVKNLGRSGDTIEMMVDRFDDDVLPFKPQYMFILGGSNSIRGGATGESVIASIQIIKEKCEKNGITPIFLTLPPVNPERIERVFKQSTAGNWQNELAKVNQFLRTQPNYIDIYPYLVDDRGFLPVEYAEDGLHPDISGKRIMARCIISFLQKHRF